MPNDPTMRTSLQSYATALKTFSSSPSTFRILSTGTSHLPPPKTLYILDSSFNPPTLAHLRLATTALLYDTHQTPSPKRLLMMQAFASDLLSSLQSFPPASKSPASTSADAPDPEGAHEIGVDIGVTKMPYFTDKADAIDSSGDYEPGTPQVHLVGFDTLIRILDTKYYPPSHTLSSLIPFLEKHRLRVSYRTDDQWGAREVQDKYLSDIKEGKRDGDGAKREWVGDGRIELVEGREEGGEIVSSTKVREAVRGGDEEALKKLVTKGVAAFILEERLYKDA